MNLLIRLFKTLLLYFFRPKPMDLLGESKLRFRVWPNDLDTNMHVNNGRYLTIMDLGRLDLLLRIGAAKHAIKQRWYPVLAGLQMRYRRPLNVFQTFELKTRIVTWDEKWVYLEQKIIRKGELMTHAYLRGAFVGPGGSVPITRLLGIMGVTQAPPPMPEALAAWKEAEAVMVKAGQSES